MPSVKDLSLDDTRTQACTEKDLFKNDRISDLPDDILIHILLSFSLKEAGSTSVLSKRWRDVWSYVPSLQFNPCDRISDLFYRETSPEKREKVREEEHKYVRWVDAVVSSHKADIIDEFTVSFRFIFKRHKNNIDSWLRFAMAKRVKRLELDLFPGCSRSFSYNIPSLFSVGRLTSLKLCWVLVTGEEIEKLLHDCPTLEFLSVDLSSVLVNLKVEALNLRTLKLTAVKMEHLEIYAPNLISFEYCGPKLSSWPLISTPKLAELSIGGYFGTHFLSNFMDLSSIFSQIEVLSLHSLTYCGPGGFSGEFPVGPRIKMLDFCLYTLFEHELFGLGSLIHACPLLHKFVLRLNENGMRCTYGDWERKEACPHHELKIVEIIGFNGDEVEYRFVEHLIKTAVLLERIFIKADCYYSNGMEESRAAARTKAEGLHAILKPGTVLEVE